MLTDPGDGANKPNPIETVKTEWNWDFDDYWHELKSLRRDSSPARHIRLELAAIPVRRAEK